MTPDQVSAWAASGESEMQEFKLTTGERRAAAQTVCAMLNNRGGRVLFGVTSDGRVTGASGRLGMCLHNVSVMM